jgi:hypothetical protein
LAGVRADAAGRATVEEAVLDLLSEK